MYNFDTKEYYMLLLYNFSMNSVVPRTSKLVIVCNVEVIFMWESHVILISNSLVTSLLTMNTETSLSMLTSFLKNVFSFYDMIVNITLRLMGP